MSNETFGNFMDVLERCSEFFRITDIADRGYRACAFYRNVAGDDGPAPPFEWMRVYYMPAVANQ